MYRKNQSAFENIRQRAKDEEEARRKQREDRKIALFVRKIGNAERRSEQRAKAKALRVAKWRARNKVAKASRRRNR